MAQHRHKRDTNARTGLTTMFRPQERPARVPGKRVLERPARRPARIVAPLALLATASAVTLGLVGDDDASEQRPLAGTAVAPAVDLADRGATVSRSGARAATEAETAEAAARRADAKEAQARKQREEAAKAKAEAKAAARAEARATREAATAAAVKAADTAMWAETELNLWSGPAEEATKVGLLDEGDKVLVTGRRANGRTEVVVGGRARWVTSGYLVAKKPTAEAKVGATCSNGTSVPAGLDPSIGRVHRAVCARWPEVTDYGTTRNDGEHSQGRAIDIMVSGATGWEIADHLRANASELGIEYLIYGQKIWSVERADEGWRPMADRGSATANHYDHVHVTVW